MTDSPNTENQIQKVTNFQDLISTPFQGEINAICWSRTLIGDFSEIVRQIELNEDIVELDREELLELELSERGQLAREILLNDLQILTAHGASPSLNVIKCYESDDTNPFFPTDVYSFHVDRSPIPVDTFLCTYYGACSEILPNSQALQKIRIPEIREELKKQYHGTEAGFKSFLSEHFLDLHYQAKSNAHPISLGHGHLWRLAINHPQLQVPPCIHRAPREKVGEKRLLLIC